MIGRNIDRYLAIWQAAHPDSWFDDDSDLAKQPLLPFFSPKSQDHGDFWTSDSARDTRKFGYTYSDVLSDPQATKDNFHSKYNWFVSSESKLEGWQPVIPPDMIPLDLSRAQVYRDHLEYVLPSLFKIAAKPAKSAALTQDQVLGTAKHESISTAKPVSIVAHIGNGDSDGAKPMPNGDELTPASTGERRNREWFIDDVVERLIPFFFDSQQPLIVSQVGTQWLLLHLLFHWGQRWSCPLQASGLQPCTYSSRINLCFLCTRGSLRQLRDAKPAGSSRDRYYPHHSYAP